MAELYRFSATCPTCETPGASFLRTGENPILVRCPNCRTPGAVAEHVKKADRNGFRGKI